MFSVLEDGGERWVSGFKGVGVWVRCWVREEEGGSFGRLGIKVGE